MSKQGFVHLHTHTDYSLLEGCLKTSRLVERCSELKMHAVALTDHGNLFGAVDFYKQTLAHGIQPILGMGVYVATGSRLEKRQGGGKSMFQLVLLARNQQGYKNLIQLSTKGYTEGFYYKPRVDKELLREYRDGLIALSADWGSEINHYIFLDDMARAEAVACEYRELFGKEHFYLELQNQQRPEQARFLQAKLAIAGKTGIPVVATNDVHYSDKSQARAQEVMMCLAKGYTVADQNRPRMSSDELFLKSAEQMRALFAECPAACDNTLEIAARCHVQLDLSAMHLPRFEPPAGRTAEDYFSELCRSGLRQRYAEITPEIQKRFEYEFDVIKKMGYIPYFLIVWDFLRYAREIGVPIGPGRGSAAGSIISYALRITDIDPLRFNLLFERFLNPSRISMPDIDIDLCTNGRQRIIEYVQNKYGAENVAQIITFGSMKARGAIRDVGRVLNIPLRKVDSIAKLVPEELGITLEAALQKEPQLKQMCEEDAEVRELFDTARQLEGMNRHASVHAAGVVISDKPLTEYVPLYKHDDDVVTQYSMEPLADIGLLKMDFLGLNTLTILDTTIQYIRENYGTVVDLNTIPLHDKKAFQLIWEGRTGGLFQLESAGMTDLGQKLRPDSLEDLSAQLALYRPGPLGSGMVDNFIRRKHGQEAVSYAHTLLEDILRETYGVIVYQEQVMQIANKMAGFSLPEADNLRKAMGKKKPEIMAKYRQQFIDGSVANKVAKDIAEFTFQQIEYFAGYGFNKSHTVAYGLITYQTAYLKANYPTEFMAALLTCELGNTDRVVRYIAECQKMGIAVRPPSINESSTYFKPVLGQKAIQFGLAAIKGVGVKAVDALVRSRNALGRPFRSLYDFCENVDSKFLNKTVYDSLIKSGAFDCFDCRRAQLAAVLEHAMQAGSRVQQERKAGQMSLFAAAADEAAAQIALPDVPEWHENELLKYEKETVGFYISSHPLAKYSDLLTRFSTAKCIHLSELTDGMEVTLGLLVTSCRTITTKNGDLMARAACEDLTGQVELVIFSKTLQQCRQDVAEDKIIFARGKLDLAREEHPAIVVNEIIPLEKANERLAHAVVVKVYTAAFDEKQFQDFQELIATHRGNCDVLLEFHTPRHGVSTVKLGAEYRVNPSEAFLEQASAIFGAGHLSCHI